MRISYIPVLAIEMVFGAKSPPEMPERAMKACVVLSLPDVRPDLVHIVESRNLAVSNEGFGAAPAATARPS
jgi:hypothetical protein